MNISELYQDHLILDTSIQPIEKTFTEAMNSRSSHIHFINTKVSQRLKCTHCKGTIFLPKHTDSQIVPWISSHSACKLPGSIYYKVSEDPFFSSIVKMNSSRKVSIHNKLLALN